MRNPELTRQRLTDVAVRAMAQYGGAGVRVDRIAAESGINKRMIYHYFGGKEGLCANVLALQISALSDILIEPQLAMLRTQLASLLPSGNAPIGEGVSSREMSGLLGQTHRHAAVIVLRSLLDTQDHDLLPNGDAAGWLALTTRLCQLAFVGDSISSTQEAGTQSHKQRVSLSPVLQPIDG